MNIPLDEIYNFINDRHDDILIYRFYPHGSKKITDLKPIRPITVWNDDWVQVLCHDQEPLFYDLYAPHHVLQQINQGTDPDLKRYAAHWPAFLEMNLQSVCAPFTNHDTAVLLHSEKRSRQLRLYQDLGLQTAFWWSHAVIARDWYRYAEHDATLRCCTADLDFNIYARAWSGTRNYRLRLLDLVLEHALQSNCRITFNDHDDGVHYTRAQQIKTRWSPRHDLSGLVSHDLGPALSASYTSQHYNTCWFDVVLETLFDDDRLHLTEKILRPIACGKPFLLASTVGSLEFLRSYGFRTFHGIIDESYDEIADSEQRLLAVVSVMKHISTLSASARSEIQRQLQQVCDHNRRWFFSREFFDLVIRELNTNLAQAVRASRGMALAQNKSSIRQRFSDIKVLTDPSFYQ